MDLASLEGLKAAAAAGRNLITYDWSFWSTAGFYQLDTNVFAEVVQTHEYL